MQSHFGGLGAFAMQIGVVDLIILSCLDITRPSHYISLSIIIELQQIFGAVLWVQDKITGSLFFLTFQLHNKPSSQPKEHLQVKNPVFISSHSHNIWLLLLLLHEELVLSKVWVCAILQMHCSCVYLVVAAFSLARAQGTVSVCASPWTRACLSHTDSWVSGGAEHVAGRKISSQCMESGGRPTPTTAYWSVL